MLDDTDHIENIRTIMLFGDQLTSTRLRHKLQYHLNFRPTLAFAAPPTASYPWPYTPSWSPLTKPLPPNVHLLSLLQYNDTANNTLMLRLVHIFEKGEDPVWSLPAQLDLAKLFSSVSVTAADERSLTGVLPVSAVKNRWKWNSEDKLQQTNDDAAHHHHHQQHPAEEKVMSTTKRQAAALPVTLQSMEIKTFFINLAK